MGEQMIRLMTLAIAAGVGAASPSVAQVSAVEGNWACRAIIDGEKAGILTIYAGSYGYASVNFGSAASGTGNVQMYSDGVQFIDGNLLMQAGIEVGIMSFDQNGQDILTLSTAEKPVLTCEPR
jgi:hypothetical protein